MTHCELFEILRVTDKFCLFVMTALCGFLVHGFVERDAIGSLNP